MTIHLYKVYWVTNTYLCSRSRRPLHIKWGICFPRAAEYSRNVQFSWACNKTSFSVHWPLRTHLHSEGYCLRCCRGCRLWGELVQGKRAMFSDKMKARKVSAEHRMLMWQVLETLNTRVCPNSNYNNNNNNNKNKNNTKHQHTRGGEGWKFTGIQKSWHEENVYSLWESSSLVELSN